MEKRFGKAPRAPRDDTFKQAREIIRGLGLTVTKRDGEFRVNYPNGKEETAYYTTDAEDAINTARAMSEWQGKRL